MIFLFAADASPEHVIDGSRAESPIISTNSQLGDGNDKPSTDNAVLLVNNVAPMKLPIHFTDPPQSPVEQDLHTLSIDTICSASLKESVKPITDTVEEKQMPTIVPIVYPDSVFKVPTHPVSRRPLRNSYRTIPQAPLPQFHDPNKAHGSKRKSSDRHSRSKRRRIEPIQFVRATASSTIVRPHPNAESPIDMSFITSYFKVPDLIEPIDELVFDKLANGQDNSLVANCLRDLILSDDSDSEPEACDLIIDEGHTENSHVAELKIDNDQTVVPLIGGSPELCVPLVVEPLPAATVESHVSCNYSPTSPTRHTSTDEWHPMPVDIPTNIKFKPKSNFFHGLVRDYDIVKRNTILQTINNVETNIDGRQIGRVRRLVELYLTTDWTSTNLRICYVKLLKMCASHLRIIAAALIEIIEDNNEPIDTSRTPPAPAMSSCHQRIIVLVQKITEFAPGFGGLCIAQIERTLFHFKPKPNGMRSVIMNLVHFYLALTDIVDGDNGATSKARSFLYKSLYYMNRMAVPVIYATLLAYPDCLPRLHEAEEDGSPDDPHRLIAEGETDTLALTLLTIISNLPLYVPCETEAYQQDYRKRELSNLLRQFYNYSPNARMSYEEVVQYLMEKIRTGSLKNVAYSLILIAKRNGCEWATKHIINQHLLPMLRQSMIGTNASNDNDAQLIALLFAFSSIIKAQPVTDDISDCQQIFGSILSGIDRQPVQEAAVAALLRTARFSVANVYQRICRWSPSQAIDRKLYCMLQTFVHRKPLSFWEK